MKLAFLTNGTESATKAGARLSARYNACQLEDADVIVALGGDGFMLQTLHGFMDSGIPVYGMNQGTIGFLMNEYREDGLAERIKAAEHNIIKPLEMKTRDASGVKRTALAINEVSLLRQSYQAARLKISIDGKVRLGELISDGVLVATPAGSTAYNLSAYGPILPLNAPLLALTPVSPFRPRRWRGALIPDHSKIAIEVLQADKRPVNAVADHNEVKSVVSVEIRAREKFGCTILFDADHSWDERILAEQFQY